MDLHPLPSSHVIHPSQLLQCGFEVCRTFNALRSQGNEDWYRHGDVPVTLWRLKPERMPGH